MNSHVATTIKNIHKPISPSAYELISYDICVITAANEYQAKGYREQLKWRMDRGMLPEKTEFLVIPDPHGKRIGSGGSTIYVLYKLLEQQVGQSALPTFNGKRILILHSGGDSRRLPAYSAVGKLFTPLPTSRGMVCNETSWQHVLQNGFVTLFDLFLNNLMQLPYMEEGQLIVASGDVLLSFDAAEVAFSDSGLTGLAYPGPVEVASNHGVYVVPHSGNFIGTHHAVHVQDFLQKPTHDELERCSGLDAAGRAFVDTGVMNFAPDAIEILMTASGVSMEEGKVAVAKDSLCENLINANIQLDIYKEIPFAILGKIPLYQREEPQQFPLFQRGIKGDFREYLCQSAADYFMNNLKGIPFFVCLLSYCEFFHVGTSKQLIQNFHTINHTASIYGFQNFSKTASQRHREEKSNPSLSVSAFSSGNAFVYNSLINSDSIEIAGPSIIEGCHLEGKIQLGGENILTCIPRGAGDIKLEKGVCLTCVPIGGIDSDKLGSMSYLKGWVAITYGINDDFKDETATFLNEPFSKWMQDRSISPSDLWKDGEPHDLWHARLFPFSPEPAHAVFVGHAASLSVGHAAGLSNVPQAASLSGVDLWQNAPRMSLHEILQSVDYEKLLENCSNLCREINLNSLEAILTPMSELSSAEVLSWCVEPDDYIKAIKMTYRLIEETHDTLFQARLYKLLSNIIQNSPFVKGDSGGFLNLHKLLCNSIVTNIRENPCQSVANISEYYEDKAFELIREAIGKGISQFPGLPISPKINIRSDEVVWVCAPARLDFAGGWTDTPPYCLEHGGSVLNAAVKLNGQYPIQVIGKLHPEPYIKLNSIDLGERVEIHEMSDLLSYQDPSDWTSLPKAAFIASGIIPESINMKITAETQRTQRDALYPLCDLRASAVNTLSATDGGDIPSLHDILKQLGNGIDLTNNQTSPPLVNSYQSPPLANSYQFPPLLKGDKGGFKTDVCLKDILKQLGSGIDLTLFSAVPAGSGLGTSSILGAAVIVCLSRMIGQELTPEELFNRTLYMEQLMTTGGGWQDQIGGVVGGIKLIQTDPGLYQVPRISWTDLNSESGQFLLYYTGMRRMAKNILRNIVGKYLDRDPAAMKTLSQLWEKSIEIKEALDYRDIEAFGKLIAEVWELNKTLDPGTSNDDIEAILEKISHLIYGAKLLGAGGGGFLFIVAKGNKEAQKVRGILTTDGCLPNPRVRFFDFDVDASGLRLNIL